MNQACIILRKLGGFKQLINCQRYSDLKLTVDCLTNFLLPLKLTDVHFYFRHKLTGYPSQVLGF